MSEHALSKRKNQKNDPCARGSYDEHAKNLQAKARTAHAEWFAGLSEAEKARAKALHIDTLPDDSTEVGGHSPYSVSDIADSPLAKCESEFGNDTPEDELADRYGIPPETAKAILEWHRQETADAIRLEQANYLQIIVGGLLASNNPKLNAAALAFAANLDALNGLPNQREFAKLNHISRQAVSKVVIAWKKALQLTPSAHQKSEHACRIYSEVGKKKHWRGRKIKASTASALLSRIQAKSTNLN